VKYTVRIEAQVTFEVEVEAYSAEEAKATAQETLDMKSWREDFNVNVINSITISADAEAQEETENRKGVDL